VVDAPVRIRLWAPGGLLQVLQPEWRIRKINRFYVVCFLWLPAIAGVLVFLWSTSERFNSARAVAWTLFIWKMGGISSVTLRCACGRLIPGGLVAIYETCRERRRARLSWGLLFISGALFASVVWPIKSEEFR